MFEIVIEVSNELYKLRRKRFIPRFYKDYRFKKYTKECVSKISTYLHENVLDYNIMVDLLRFYMGTYEYMEISNSNNLPFRMMNGTDVISIMYKLGNLKCDMRYNIANRLDITKVYTEPDEENYFKEIQNKTYTTITSAEIDTYDKVRLIGQIIKYLNIYMTLVYEYGVEENETDIH